VNAALFYSVTTSGTITVGTTDVAFAVVTPSNPLTMPLPLANGGTSGTSKATAASALGIVSLTGAGGTNNAQTAGAPSNYAAFAANDIFEYTPSVTNTGATTLTITPSGGSALSAKNVFAGGAALAGGELTANLPVLLLYDGTRLNIIGRSLTLPSLTVSGTLTPQALVDISGASAGQIKFPATQNASSNANTLDDYEEGTWTPSIGGNATYSTQSGTYTKIGRLVYIRVNLVINVIGTGSTQQVSGLPFQASTSGSPPVMFSFFSSLASNVVYLAGQISTASTSFSIQSLTAAGAATAANAIFQNAAQVQGAGTYEV